MEMDSTLVNYTQRSTPSALAKSASRLARNAACSVQGKDPPPHLSLDLVAPSSPKKGQSTPSSFSVRSSTTSLPLPLRDLLLLSPSPSRKSRVRLADRIDMAAEEAGGGVEPTGARRRCKSRGSQVGSLPCASPRNGRRLRKRSEVEIREDRESVVGLGEESGKPRKRRHGGGTSRSKKEKLALVPAFPSSGYSPKADGCDGNNLDRLGATIYDLVMWEDVAKSTLWFGFGSLCFLSSCFAKGIHFSIFSAISQLGLLLLGAKFFSNSICQRKNNENEREVRLKEEDIMRLGRLILPPANLAISKIMELFSGEPSMTLKVIPFLLLGAEYGHLITLWRLCAVGFFVSFTSPKLYSSYSDQIIQRVETAKCRMLETWGCCSHKKLVTASAITAFWNLSSIKTRIFTAFIALVILRCCRQNILPVKEDEAVAVEAVQEENEAAAAAAEIVLGEGDGAEEDMEVEEEQEEALPLVVTTEVKSLKK